MGMYTTLWRVSQTQLEQYQQNSTLLEPAIYAKDFGQEDDSVLDIGKAWDALLFLLTGAGIGRSEGPLASIYLTGQLIDPEQDLGYGPAHYLVAADVQRVNVHLQDLTPDALQKRYDADALIQASIYPSSWSAEDGTYLIEVYKELQAFYQAAAQEEQAVISFVL